MDTLTWTFISMTFDGSNKSLKYYANGQLINTIDLLTKGLFPDPAEALLLIAPNYPSIGTPEGIEAAVPKTPHTPGLSNTIPAFMQENITGNIDDIRVFNKTLTDQQINDLFVLGNQGR